MSRATIIFGNGLGMALNSEWFSLEFALKKVWSDTTALTSGHKQLILGSIEGASESSSPRSEEQLDKLHQAIVASEILKDLEKDGCNWLTDYAKDLPRAFKKYIHETALHFHKSRFVLPSQFLASFSSFVENTKSHVATLNYDNLLYDGLIDKKVLNDYRGSLLDGFRRKSGFKDENLDRECDNSFGWYMHLHGSPLYVGNKKRMGKSRQEINLDGKSHIVLTHVKHKPSVISASRILLSYWRRLDEAFEESEKIILFGYSGFDEHLNRKIKAHKNKRRLIVIEWVKAGQQREREVFWRQKTGFDSIQLIRLDNILDFTDWPL